MIAPLRRGHRVAWPLLAMLLPTLYAASLAARPQWPDDDLDDPGRLPGNGYNAQDGVAEIAEAALSLRQRTNRLDVEPLDGPTVPDALLYWSPRIPPPESRDVPEDAVFLGAIGGRERTVDLPESTSGALVLYSGAHRRVVAAIPLPLPEKD